MTRARSTHDPDSVFERKRLILVNRVRRLQREFKLPKIRKDRMKALSTGLALTLGEGITDPDLRVLIRMTNRGLFDHVD